jgi:F0F1-type ATP synthase assembly protein I
MMQGIHRWGMKKICCKIVHKFRGIYLDCPLQRSIFVRFLSLAPNRAPSCCEFLSGLDMVQPPLKQDTGRLEEQTSETPPSPMKEVGPYMNLGMELFAAVAGFGLIGWFIDSKAGTQPLWMAILLFAGAIGGMYNFIRTALKQSSKPSSQNLS